MIWVDTGPLVALFDPRDGKHRHCRQVLASLNEPLYTTIPVLTEAFHMLSPGSQGCARLMDFIGDGGLCTWFLDDNTTERAFALMNQYADQAMDLADASLIVAAETTRCRTLFTLDRKNFLVYRARLGHRRIALKIVS